LDYYEIICEGAHHRATVIRKHHGSSVADMDIDVSAASRFNDVFYSEWILLQIWKVGGHLGIAGIEFHQYLKIVMVGAVIDKALKQVW
jgi:hypothetical protein